MPVQSVSRFGAGLTLVVSTHTFTITRHGGQRVAMEPGRDAMQGTLIFPECCLFPRTTHEDNEFEFISSGNWSVGEYISKGSINSTFGSEFVLKNFPAI